MQKYYIDSDIRKAETLPASFYKDDTVFDYLREKLFTKTWHWIGDRNLVPLSTSAYPFVLLENFLEEPLLLVRNKEDQLRCLSNVCTHRGNIVVQNPGQVRDLSCLYHGRRFDLDGNFKSMPEFKQAEDFPRPCDSLHEFALAEWGAFIFTGLEPAFDFNAVVEQMNERIGFLPLSEFKLDKSSSKDYLINCHWALYCDNYLEGFHIPFVHPDLNAVLDYGNYKSELYDYCNLQIGYAQGGEEVFDLPADHIDKGKNVAAYYYWVFPNMMFNFYPWGLSINIVRPINKHKTKVSFVTYVYDESKRQSGAGALLDKVEREDEFVVEGVHKGLQSRYYKAGRFSPTMEKGVHQFHRLLARFVSMG